MFVEKSPKQKCMCLTLLLNNKYSSRKVKQHNNNNKRKKQILELRNHSCN
jgi:hypothetical protein